MDSAYRRNLINTVLEASRSSFWDSAVQEWVVDDCEEDNSLSSACICGKERLRYALRSKRSNYQTKTEEWIKATQQWIDETSEKEMASMIGIPAKFIDKKKIHLFVLGRKHGNYSNGKLPNKKSTWGQWYQFLHLSKVLRSQSKLTLSKMHIVLDQSNPFKRKVVEAVNVFSYGKYRIIFGGNAMGVISELLSRFNIVGHTK